MKSILYVSRASLSPGGEEEEVERLVAAARERNRRQRVSGALIFTGHHFAQVLEGTVEDVDAIMASILCDPRHRSLRSFSSEAATRRRFANWGLVYSGTSTFVDRRIRRLFTSAGEEGELRSAEEELLDLHYDLAVDA